MWGNQTPQHGPVVPLPSQGPLLSHYLEVGGSRGRHVLFKPKPRDCGGGVHHPAVLCWARVSWNATTCHQPMQRALVLLTFLCRLCVNIIIWPQGIRVLHQYLWGIFSISALIHLHGWLTRSGPSGLDWGWLVDDQTLGLAALVGVDIHRGPSSWSGCGALTVPILAGVGVVYHSVASPPDRKRVTPVGKVGLPPNSSFRPNWTCFLGLSSMGVGPYLAVPLLLDLQVLPCSFRSLM